MRRLQKWHLFVASIVLLAAMIVILDRVFPPPVDKVTVSTLVTDRDGRWLHAFPVVGEEGQRTWRFRADLSDIDPLFLERVVAIEDKRFWSHPGVDVLAVLRATGSLIRQGEIVSGASTITMQTARLLEPRPRNIGSKLIEMIRAVQLEARYSKEEILSLYLTLAPYGGNVEGVRAASLVYFDKEPAELTDAQIALLIALPQAPEARRPDRRQGAASAARNVILQKLETTGHLLQQAYEEAAEATMPTRRNAFERLGWHAALERKRALPEVEEIETTLDAGVQREAEQLSRRHATRASDKANVSLLIVDNHSMAVRALVGSASTDLPGGWIDMTSAIRSPGSTLKPFIYGLAFEDGLASDRTLIKDAPTSFDGYKPENFSRLFHGDVTLSEALQHSLNVPAVLALDKIGPRRFAASLQATGIDLEMRQRADARASLAIALGGVGMNARALATLYAGLANDGTIRPLIWTKAELEEMPAEGYRLFTEGNADKLTEIMQLAPAPAGRSPSSLSVSAPKVAFKTGTSYGFRDAWSAGYTEDYTVVVWLGHPSGEPRPGITGRKAALPLLFDVFDMLAREDMKRQRVNPTGEEGKTDHFVSGASLARLAPETRTLPPEIVFPENGIEIFYAEENRARGFLLSARGGAGDYRWYVNDQPVMDDPVNQRPIWRPAEDGFYRVTVVDETGKSASSSVRVSSAG
jgi:penicillin-binding protein 1C